PPGPQLEAGAHVRAGMDDDAREAKRLGALELVGEGVDRLRPERRVRVAEVDEIARVREDVTDRVSPARGPELADLVRRERLRRPLPLIFQEDLDRAAAQLATALEGEEEPARDRHVRADLVARSSHGGHASTLLFCANETPH